MNILAPFVSVDDERMLEGFSLVLEEQDQEGRWLCEKEPKGGRWMKKFVPLEEIGQPSKWITLYAMKMLKTTHLQQY